MTTRFIERADSSIKAIETRYKGYRFRSRLEARWAVYFDTLGWKWEYEKEGYDFSALRRYARGDYELGYYLPDFWLPELEAWVEIKGALPEHSWRRTREEALMMNLVEHTRAKYGSVIFGQPHEGTPMSSCYMLHPDYIYSQICTEDERTCFQGPGEKALFGIVFDDSAAMLAARSARFEHGESGAR